MFEKAPTFGDPLVATYPTSLISERITATHQVCNVNLPVTGYFTGSRAIGKSVYLPDTQDLGAAVYLREVDPPSSLLCRRRFHQNLRTLDLIGQWTKLPSVNRRVEESLPMTMVEE